MFHLAKCAEAQAFRLVEHGEVTSTNEEALLRANAGDPGRLWVVAKSQTAGRGRNGRTWSSPAGNLYASLLLLNPALPHKAPELGFVAGIAAAHTIRAILRRGDRVRIKWPNDVLFDGAKCCGILIESALLCDGQLACTAGIGVNCRAHPQNTPYPATDLMAISGNAIEAKQVFAELSGSMAHWLGVWAAGAGFALIRTEWLSLASGVGTRVRVALPSHTIEGIFRTIDASGRLVLERPGETLTIGAGDVFQCIVS
ncbi:MAG: biotin--[acetyl-CoA-carboxylase] ligase [Methylocapsa sp.]|nr:biotin--[acetyl-CoA-carboxylase] ligase [Methylocapsa sp.]